MNVKQFVMLLTAQSIISAAASGQKNPYRKCSEIPCIYCNDGTAISVQAHGKAQCTFRGIKHNRLGRSETFGSELLCCESPALNPYDSEDLPIIEAFVATHGGIDIQTTMEKAVKTAQFVIAQSLQYEEDDF